MFFFNVAKTEGGGGSEPFVKKENVLSLNFDNSVTELYLCNGIIGIKSAVLNYI